MLNNFVSPKSIEELCVALRNKCENTYVIAGGTDLTIKFVKEQIYDFNIIDLGKMKELKYIEVKENTIKIGSGATMTEIENNEDLKRVSPSLTLAASMVGSTQIRNRATIGGNIANAAQCGDTLPVLFAFDAKLKILNSLNEYRYENVKDFVLGINKTTLKSDEIIISIEMEITNQSSSFSKVGSRKTVTIAKLNCCGKFDLDETNYIKDATIYMGAIGITPVKADLIEKNLIGNRLENLREDLEESIIAQIEKAIPDRNSKHYKKVAAKGLIQDMLNNLRR